MQTWEEREPNQDAFLSEIERERAIDDLKLSIAIVKREHPRSPALQALEADLRGLQARNS